MIMMSWITMNVVRPFIKFLDLLAPIGNFCARIWIASIFFKAGLSKIASWSTTLLLFQYEYHVPFVSPFVAAVIGTGAELLLPVLLVMGLGGRFIISIFFVYNVVCMIAYPFLWTPDGTAGLAEHINWGILLGLLMLYGSDKIALDHLLLRWDINKTRKKLDASVGL